MRLSILLLLVFSAQGLPAQGRFPNIVVVLADDMGWGDPRETKNRYTDEPDTVAELAKLLDRIRKSASCKCGSSLDL